jgi:ABC-type cobalamin/Fe3+-siderophores transport system ATPase subunit
MFFKGKTKRDSKEQNQSKSLHYLNAVELSESQMESVSGGQGAIFLLILQQRRISIGELERIKS